SPGARPRRPGRGSSGGVPVPFPINSTQRTQRVQRVQRTQRIGPAQEFHASPAIGTPPGILPLCPREGSVPHRNFSFVSLVSFVSLASFVLSCVHFANYRASTSPQNPASSITSPA